MMVPDLSTFFQFVKFALFAIPVLIVVALFLGWKAYFAEPPEPIKKPTVEEYEVCMEKRADTVKWNECMTELHEREVFGSASR